MSEDDLASKLNTIIEGDCREVMKTLPSKSIDLIITSPPYWQIKDYGSAGQIGFQDTYEEYIENLTRVWKQCYRVLRDGCRLCINVGDVFASSTTFGRYKVIPIRESIIRYCEEIGFDYMGAIIWQKITNAHPAGGAVFMGSYPYPRNGIVKIDYEFILIFKKQGDAPKPLQEHKERSKMTKEEWKTFFSGHWYFPGARQNMHIAMFPEELPKRLIKMFSFVGETILDPFVGSGTTAFAALRLGRKYIGIEIRKKYCALARKRVRREN
jgi:site-specific DNA-methyltransferase (adenine-specific)